MGTSRFVLHGDEIYKVRTTTIPFREWPWRARVIERIYRWVNGGKIRTLVIRSDSEQEHT